MAVVMLMQTVSPLWLRRIRACNRRATNEASSILLFRELAQLRQRKAILPAAHMKVPPSQNKQDFAGAGIMDLDRFQ
jgi:hypothetical protein